METANSLVRDTATMSWEPTDFEGVERKLLAPADGPLAVAETELLRLAPDTALPPAPAGPHESGAEALVLEGTWELPEGALEHGGYARRPPGTDGGRAGAAGCVLFVRWRPFASGDTRAVHVPLKVPGHGGMVVVVCGKRSIRQTTIPSER